MTLLGWIAAAPVHVYRWTIGPMVPKVCRFEPSCSGYAARALVLHGPFRGGWLTLHRLLRCHPWGGYGYDPVPGDHDCHGHGR
ncbi:MAG: membrane protein insertion efficiency factor YidD [Alphaproteobacteria bacterium]|nr:membrane protein insertion efficiency factor YidD [Alphaproteobacteria bacterium]